MIWFKFYSIWGDGLTELSDAEAGRFLKAVCYYAETGKIQSLSGNERILFAMALKQLKQDADRSTKISSVRAEAGRMGGLASKQNEAKEANESNCLQNEAKNSNCSIKNKELRIKNIEEELKERDKRENARSQKDIKHRHGNFQHVFLTDDEYSRLKADFSDCETLIQNLDDYLENNPSKHYANHNLTIRNWARRDAEKKPVSQQKNETWIEAAERVAMSMNHIEVLP